MWSSARQDHFFRNVGEGPRLGQPLCLHSFTSVYLFPSLSLSFSHPLCLHIPTSHATSPPPHTLFCLPLKGGLFHLSSMDFHWPVFLSLFITPLIAHLWHPPLSPIWLTFALLCQSSGRSHFSLKPAEYESLRLQWKIRQRIIYLCCKLTRFNEELIKINQ